MARHICVTVTSWPTTTLSALRCAFTLPYLPQRSFTTVWSLVTTATRLPVIRTTRRLSWRWTLIQHNPVQQLFSDSSKKLKLCLLTERHYQYKYKHISNQSVYIHIISMILYYCVNHATYLFHAFKLKLLEVMLILHFAKWCTAKNISLTYLLLLSKSDFPGFPIMGGRPALHL